jgi:hypothetical protein
MVRARRRNGENKLGEEQEAGGLLTEEDHQLLERFLGSVLDRYKNDEIERDDAIGVAAYLIAEVEIPGDRRWGAYMRAIIGER